MDQRVHGTKRARPRPGSPKLVNDTNRGTFVARCASRTFGEWLVEWGREGGQKPPAKAPSTYEHYLAWIDQHLGPKLGTIPLQALNAADLKRAYTEATRNAGQSVRGGGARRARSPVHHVVAHSALQAAVLGARFSATWRSWSPARLAAAPIAGTF